MKRRIRVEGLYNDHTDRYDLYDLELNRVGVGYWNDNGNIQLVIKGVIVGEINPYTNEGTYDSKAVTEACNRLQELEVQQRMEQLKADIEQAQKRLESIKERNGDSQKLDSPNESR